MGTRNPHGAKISPKMHPKKSPAPALWRIVEVCVGVIVAVLVSSLLWPRYARKEFMGKMQLALEELRKGLESRSLFFLEHLKPSALMHAISPRR
jgi:uncharacterized membrane protein YccC